MHGTTAGLVDLNEGTRWPAGNRKPRRRIVSLRSDHQLWPLDQDWVVCLTFPPCSKLKNTDETPPSAMRWLAVHRVKRSVSRYSGSRKPGVNSRPIENASLGPSSTLRSDSGPPADRGTSNGRPCRVPSPGRRMRTDGTRRDHGGAPADHLENRRVLALASRSTRAHGFGPG
jgi:hypothetical protein